MENEHGTVKELMKHAAPTKDALDAIHAHHVEISRAHTITVTIEGDEDANSSGQ